MKNHQNFFIRPMKRQEMKIAISWAAAEGWNPGLSDADSFYSADKNGFFMGFLKKEPIACISAVAYDIHFGFIGFYIVKPKYRGQGYGLKLWQKALEYLNGRNIGLDGVLTQQENYQKSHFKLAYRNIRYQGISEKKQIKHPNIVKLSQIPFTKIAKYDRLIFPSPRGRFLKKWIAQPGSISLGILDNKHIKGYGVIRPCQTGFKIGPLFADNEHLAKDLLQSLLNSLPSKSIFFLDVPEINSQALDLALKHNLKKVFTTVRMYNKNKPKIMLNHCFGVTSFELG